jgi:hypothetical protein
MTKIQKHKEKKSKTLWVIIVIRNAICVGKQWFPHTI